MISNDGRIGIRVLSWLVALFVGSGCAALIYEIVWFQLLQHVIGSTAISLGLLLGMFMGGMCLGSLVLPRVVSARWHPLVVYALLEFGIGVIGLLELFALPYVSRLYVANAANGFPGLLLRGMVCASCLFPPTVLMGATLPAIGRWVEATPRGVSWLGIFYGGNIFGAVIGCLLAGFYLLRVHDVTAATFVAAGINAFVAVVALAMAKLVGYRPAPAGPIPAISATPASSKVCWVIALSGFCALGAQVVWTRQLSLLLGGTVYAFAIILAVFLSGLGVGSSAGASLARDFNRPQLALGACQFLLAAAIAWAAFSLNKWLPGWAPNSAADGLWSRFAVDVLRCASAILPATILWGASFPLALAAMPGRDQDSGRLVGKTYAANTAGAIVGALAFSLVVIGWLGTQNAQRLLIMFVCLAAVLAWSGSSKAAAAVRRMERASAAFRPLKSAASGSRPVWKWSALFGAGLVLVVALVFTLPGMPAGVAAYGRYAASLPPPRLLFVGEGINATVAVSERDDGTRQFHVSGRVEASTEPQDMRLQRMLGHLPALLHPNPRSVLVVGCGAGVTAGAFVVQPGIERIVICEIEPLIPNVVANYFADKNHHVLEDPRVEVVYDDARHYILTTGETFDIITSDPIHPWIKGSSSLYTREYFELLKAHLNPGGVLSQWVPLYKSDSVVVKCELATFFDVFPQGTVWSNDQLGRGYDVVLLGGTGRIDVDVSSIGQWLNADDHELVTDSLREVGFGSALELIATYAGQAPDLRPWLEGAEINLDRNLRLQYLAGLSLNLNRGVEIHEELLRHRRFPSEWLEVSAAQEAALMRVWGGSATDVEPHH